MNRTAILGTMVAAILATGACTDGTGGVVLPDGDAERGMQAFVELECTACHTVSDRALPAPEVAGPVKMPLGGQVSKVKSYSELVTSVINPSHRLARNLTRQQIAQDGESVMPVYNDVMTVTQLVDIVTFLESEYEKFERPSYKYPVYHY